MLKASFEIDLCLLELIKAMILLVLEIAI